MQTNKEYSNFINNVKSGLHEKNKQSVVATDVKRIGDKPIKVISSDGNSHSVKMIMKGNNADIQRDNKIITYKEYDDLGDLKSMLQGDPFNIQNEQVSNALSKQLHTDTNGVLNGHVAATSQVSTLPGLLVHNNESEQSYKFDLSKEGKMTVSSSSIIKGIRVTGQMGQTIVPFRKPIEINTSIDVNTKEVDEKGQLKVDNAQVEIGKYQGKTEELQRDGEVGVYKKKIDGERLLKNDFKIKLKDTLATVDEVYKAAKPRLIDRIKDFIRGISTFLQKIIRGQNNTENNKDSNTQQVDSTSNTGKSHAAGHDASANITPSVLDEVNKLAENIQDLDIKKESGNDKVYPPKDTPPKEVSTVDKGNVRG